VIEDELKAAFARHEELTPPTGPVRAAIDTAARRRRRRRTGAVATAGVLALAAMVGVPLTLTGAVPPPSVIGQLLPLPAEPEREPVTLLVLGIDDVDGSHRADTVMVLHVPAEGGTGYVLTLPRDLRVEVPDRGRARLGDVFFYGSHRTGAQPDLAAGSDLTAETVRADVGLPVDATVTLRFGGLRRLTDALGGVQVCLDRPVSSRHTGRQFPAACQELDGVGALDLLRQRYGRPNGAYDRDATSRRFAQALLDRALSRDVLTDPARAADVLRAVGQGLSVRGDLSLADLTGVAATLDRLVAVDIGSSFRGEVVDGASYERLDDERSGPVFAAIRDDDLGEWVSAHPEAVTQR
jgi:LCP family protein required for cell wall assembly